MTPTSQILDPSEVAFAGKTVLKLSTAAIEDNGEATPRKKTISPQTTEGFSAPVLAAMTKLVEIVAELRSPMGGWPRDLPKTSENLIPYVLEEAYDVLDAIEESPEPPKVRGEDERGRGGEGERGRGGEKFIVVDDLIPRLLWDAIESSYDVMQLIGGVRAQLVRSPQETCRGFLRLVVGLAVSSGNNRWFVDLATHNADRDRGDSDFCPPECLIHSPNVLLCQQPIAAGALVAHLQREIECSSPELARLMEPNPVEWLHPHQQWLTGQIQFTMDLEFLPEPDPEPQDPETENPEAGEQTVTEMSPPLELNSSRSQPAEPDGGPPLTKGGLVEPTLTKEGLVEPTLTKEGLAEPPLTKEGLAEPPLTKMLLGGVTRSHSMIRLSQPAMLQEAGKTPFQQALIGLLPTLQQLAKESEKSANAPTSTVSMLANDDLSESPTVISQLVSTAYDLVEAWEFPWREGEVLIDECMHRLLWQTITSSYPVMQLIGSMEAMILSPGLDWEIGILRLLAIFQIEVGNQTITVDLSTGKFPESNRVLDPKTIVRSPATELPVQPVIVEHLLNHLSQQIQASTPAFEWLIHGAKVDLLNSEGIWESGFAQFRLEFEFIPA